MKKKNTVKFDRANRIITFEGKVIVDLRLIGTPSKARLYSKSGSDATGLNAKKLKCRRKKAEFRSQKPEGRKGGKKDLLAAKRHKIKDKPEG